MSECIPYTWSLSLVTRAPSYWCAEDVVSMMKPSGKLFLFNEPICGAQYELLHLVLK